MTDGLAPLSSIDNWLRKTADLGCGGCVLLIADPAEQTFPYKGRVKFTARASDWSRIFGKSQSIREAYLDKRRDHFEALTRFVQAAGLNVVTHQTDESATEAAIRTQAKLEAAR